MSKFETEQTLMYEFLVNELQEEMNLIKERILILKEQGDYENAQFESNCLVEIRNQWLNMVNYLNKSRKSHCSKPITLQLITHDQFDNTKLTESIRSNQYDDSSFYHEKTPYYLINWVDFEENEIYIINNLLFKKQKGELLSKFVHENFWHVESLNGVLDDLLLIRYGNLNIYKYRKI